MDLTFCAPCSNSRFPLVLRPDLEFEPPLSSPPSFLVPLPLGALSPSLCWRFEPPRERPPVPPPPPFLASPPPLSLSFLLNFAKFDGSLNLFSSGRVSPYSILRMAS